MCVICGQPDWRCEHKPEYGFKQVKNEKTGYSILNLDFRKMAIIREYHECDDKPEVYDFPINWNEITCLEKAEWILSKMKPQC